MATWPTTLPQELPEDSFSLSLPDNLIRTNMSYGPAKVRRRTTSNVTKVSGQLILSAIDLTAFQTFYVTTITYGAISFTFPTHPITGVSCTMRFTEPPKYSPAGGEYTNVSLELEILL